MEPGPVANQELLDAIDGVAMILDSDLRIAQIGKPNWDLFMEENSQPGPAAAGCSVEDVLGHPVTRFIAGDAVRRTFATLFESILNEARPFVHVDYRCDAPELRRDMRLSVSPIVIGQDLRYLLYQSITLSVTPRPAIPLFGAPVADHDAEDVLTLCAICARVAWPAGAPKDGREWIEPPEYYRRGGGDVALISHGFCEDCFAKLDAGGSPG